VLGSGAADDIKEKSKSEGDDSNPKTSDHEAPKRNDSATKRRPPDDPPQRWAAASLCALLIGAVSGIGLWLYRRRLKPRDRFPTDESLLVSDEYY
jgi:hypothetical protein